MQSYEINNLALCFMRSLILTNVLEWGNVYLLNWCWRSIEFMLAPALTSMSTISKCPLFAAWNKAVSPCLSDLSRFFPSAISAATSRASPLMTAMCSGVYSWTVKCWEAQARDADRRMMRSVNSFIFWMISVWVEEEKRVHECFFFDRQGKRFADNLPNIHLSSQEIARQVRISTQSI